MRKYQPALAVFLLVLFIAGCASLQPTANPLVVRAEQTEKAAFATFEMVLHVDDSNRPFWSTNAASFHQFCEWLRQPTVVNVTNTLPRGAAIILTLDNTKKAYQSNLVGQDQLAAALAAVEKALADAQLYFSSASASIPKPIQP